MMYADLHIHTNYSDGVHEITEVFTLAKEAGLHTIAICDHDTVFHFPEIKKVAESTNLTWIPGVELSCYDMDVYKKVHIIGLYVKNIKELDEMCQYTLACREAYHKEMIKDLCNDGYIISYDEAKAFAPYNIIFKLHLFLPIYYKYLNKEKGGEFYKQYFNRPSDISIDKKMGYIPVQDGIKAILRAGGIPILAHPSEYDNFDEIEKYVSYGLKGIEVNHPHMKNHDIIQAKLYTKKFHLLESGGSDFHGQLEMMKDMSLLGKYGLTKQEFDNLIEQM